MRTYKQGTILLEEVERLPGTVERVYDFTLPGDWVSPTPHHLQVKSETDVAVWKDDRKGLWLDVRVPVPLNCDDCTPLVVRPGVYRHLSKWTLRDQFPGWHLVDNLPDSCLEDGEFITKLSPAEKARVLQIREKWLQAARSCKPADRPEAESGIRQAYEEVSLAPPERIIWVKSPFGVFQLLSNFGDPYDLVKKSVWDKMQVNITAASRRIDAWVVDALTDFATGSPEIQSLSEWRFVIAENLLRSLPDINKDAAKDIRIWIEMDRRLKIAFINSSHDGQDHSVTLASLDIWSEFGVCECKKISGVMKAARSCGWWWPFRDFAVAAERHSALCCDAEGRLHRERGPALQYPDGWPVWAWHGSVAPEKFIMRPEALTADDIRTEENPEVKRAMIGHYGASKLMGVTEAKVLDEDQDRFGPRTLFWVPPYPGYKPIVMIRVHSRNKAGEYEEHWLRVPPNVKTCKEAIAWTFGVKQEDYHLDEES